MLCRVVKGPKSYGSPRPIMLSKGISCLLEPHLSLRHQMNNKLLVVVVCVSHMHSYHLYIFLGIWKFKKFPQIK